MRIEDIISEDNLFDTSTTAPHSILRRPIRVTNENLSFDIRG